MNQFETENDEKFDEEATLQEDLRSTETLSGDPIDLGVETMSGDPLESPLGDDSEEDLEEVEASHASPSVPQHCIDTASEEGTNEVRSIVAMTMRQAQSLIGMITGGGGAALLVCDALGYYAEKQVKRARDAEAAAGLAFDGNYERLRVLTRADVDATFEKLPALTADVVRKAAEAGLPVYDDARRALEKEAAANAESN